MSGTIVNRIKLESCDGCGVQYITKVMVRHVEKLTQASEEAFEFRLCPECKRFAQAARMVGQKPDFNEVLRRKGLYSHQDPVKQAS